MPDSMSKNNLVIGMLKIIKHIVKPRFLLIAVIYQVSLAH